MAASWSRRTRGVHHFSACGMEIVSCSVNIRTGRRHVGHVSVTLVQYTSHISTHVHKKYHQPAGDLISHGHDREGGTHFIHYDDVIMGAMASQITSPAIVYSTVYSGTDQRKHQRSASLAFVRGIHRGPVNSPHKWPVTRKMFLFDDVIMKTKQSRYHTV